MFIALQLFHFAIGRVIFEQCQSETMLPLMQERDHRTAPGRQAGEQTPPPTPEIKQSSCEKYY